MTRAEDRAPRRRDPSAVPGAKTGAGRHDAALSLLRDWHQCDKSMNRKASVQKIIISQPRFFHFTLNQYTVYVNRQGNFWVLGFNESPEQFFDFGRALYPKSVGLG